MSRRPWGVDDFIGRRDDRGGGAQIEWERTDFWRCKRIVSDKFREDGGDVMGDRDADGGGSYDCRDTIY